MKLLNKSAIISQQNTEKKAAIDSGIFIAEKVDALRRDFASLKEQRENFIKGSQEALNKAISELKNEKVNLEVAIAEQTKLLAKLREPLDEEWAKVEESKAKLAASQEEVDTFLAELSKERAELEVIRQEAVKFMNEAEKNSKKASEHLEIAQKNRIETRIALEKATFLKETQETNLFIKETELEAREKALKLKESQYKKDVEALKKEKYNLELKKKRWKTLE